MPLVKPLRGLLYADTDPAAVARVLAPPFDMVKGGQQQALFALSQHNIARLTVADDGPGYPGAAERLAEWKRDGVLTQDSAPAVYAYEHDAGEAMLRGFVAAVRLENSPECAVYGHENTFAGPMTDRLSLMRATECSLEPVFGIYEDEEGRTEVELQQATAGPPLWEAKTPDGALHRLWPITDPRRQAALSDIVSPRRVVIADAHHRWAVAETYCRERREAGAGAEAASEYGLMLLAEAKTGGVRCSAFHRVIQRLPEGVDPAGLPRLLGEHFEVEEFPTEGVAPEEAARALVARVEADVDGTVFGCQWATGAALVRIRDLEALLPTAGRRIGPLTREFDVALLHRLVLRPRLRCHGDYGPQACAVVFEKDPSAAWRRVTAGDAVMAWYVKPATTESVMRVAFAGKKVPQKATHFYPKPASGIVMYDLSG